MKIKDIIKFLEERFPLSLQEEWDNSGLQIGNIENDLTNIMISLDLDEQTIQKAKEKSCNLIINHHPFLFSSIKSIDLNEEKGKIIKDLIKNDITVFAMHTNLDIGKGGVNDNLAKLLELKDISNLDTNNENPMARFGYTDEITAYDFSKFVKEKLNCKGLILYGDKNKKIKKVALCGGAGSDFISDAIKKDCDLIVTSDVKYHEAIDNCKKINIVDPGHFASENHIIYMIKDLLEKNFATGIYTCAKKDSYREFI
ncbi:Nif3-like dinuclear metal center hexameric protein [Anaerococcus obesiensis]|uniref:GTP cyclohydrolase 1 type 2 homolog n=1 Tax=Anaerococcus obesiensis TaxID=1287640 RepID=A0A7T7ZV65_9FIRM|nr:MULTISPECIES: Nif3-like dinuclear metal center hexameric protein [Anaerococcus]MDU0946672.1 Nif3-like dinuclear metal center hexameric protein [Anaerococcus vaginalis]MDU1030851.1 Nif3-like dinuclear metal center hexameric protein [Anaerococcus vaginalis]QQN55963.1 Nif3-like dinuclear metal center hexameric protein [Anaerococcus obesiensis]